jgi:HD superfamily phosphodiesterase
MKRIELLKRKVRELYQAQAPGREEWADWLFANHIFLVSDEAASLAIRFDANAELAEAAGMLHDIADCVMKRSKPNHEMHTENIATELLTECKFKPSEIETIVTDAMRYHSCYSPQRSPSSLVGKVVATADAAIHLTTDFYDHAVKDKLRNEDSEDVRQWVTAKLPRDLNNKIFFDIIREEVREAHDRLKEKYDSLDWSLIKKSAIL